MAFLLYKSWLKKQFMGRTVRFSSDCIAKLDVTGTVVDTEQSGSEIIYIIHSGDRVIKIGENTPKLCIEFV